ncbi:BMC domain-containing protein [Buttiauxella noackiae]|uniref:BMC domain-containing protein n=1 Tax=Buttiauxella noackiae TaxID=82992 RepID=UPI0028D864E0|nr:BMC domain-containing protein [Buttiauxella noackiae]
MKQSLGLLEVSGLALAISCADVMAKAASITLMGLEKTNGSGWMVIKVIGDVASVQSAIATGASFAQSRDGLVAQKVIARPGNGIQVTTPEPVSFPLHAATEENAPQEVNHTSVEEVVTVEKIATSSSGLVSCNLCLDLACQRQKGEPRSLCLHSGQREE